MVYVYGSVENLKASKREVQEETRIFFYYLYCIVRGPSQLFITYIGL